ncbi:MAG: hypothetical protein M3Y87_09950 [Myxococcota bacterium]|nr:hypothetical protein [Myxococcota bacterium]
MPAIARDAQSALVPVVIDRRNVRGKIELTPHVLRSTSRTGGDEYASEEGAIVATGAPIVIAVDEEDSLMGGFLKGAWEDFEQSTDLPALRSFARATHYVSLTDPPVLYLNSSIPSLQALLSSKKTQGADAALRDVVFDAISSSAWMTLVVASTASAVKDEGDRFIAATVWSERVLEYVAPRMTGVTETSGAIDAFVRQMRDENASASVLSRVEAHFQQRDDFGTHLEKLFAAMRKDD